MSSLSRPPGLRARPSSGSTDAGLSPALRDDVAAATTAFVARACTKTPADTKIGERTANTNSLPPEFADEEHEFYSRGSWRFGGY